MIQIPVHVVVATPDNHSGAFIEGIFFSKTQASDRKRELCQHNDEPLLYLEKDVEIHETTIDLPSSLALIMSGNYDDNRAGIPEMICLTADKAAGKLRRMLKQKNKKGQPIYKKNELGYVMVPLR